MASPPSTFCDIIPTFLVTRFCTNQTLDPPYTIDPLASLDANLAISLPWCSAISNSNSNGSRVPSPACVPVPYGDPPCTSMLKEAGKVYPKGTNSMPWCASWETAVNLPCVTVVLEEGYPKWPYMSREGEGRGGGRWCVNIRIWVTTLQPNSHPKTLTHRSLSSDFSATLGPPKPETQNP